jgi:hypothetical protein
MYTRNYQFHTHKKINYLHGCLHEYVSLMYMCHVDIHTCTQAHIHITRKQLVKHKQTSIHTRESTTQTIDGDSEADSGVGSADDAFEMGGVSMKARVRQLRERRRAELISAVNSAAAKGDIASLKQVRLVFVSCVTFFRTCTTARLCVARCFGSR